MFKKIILGLGGGFVILIIIALASGDSSDSITPPLVVSEVKEEVRATTISVSNPATEKKVTIAQTTENPKPKVSTDTEFYSVIKVVDGDTLSVDINGKSETIRLIGINTPETVDPRKTVECFGKEASNKAKELLTGKKVKIEKDPTQGDRDKYGRLLAYIYIENGVLYNKYMIEAGYAYEYTYNLPYKYQMEFKAAQKQAQTAKKGLWAPGVCETTSTSQPTTPAPTQTQTTQTSSQTTTSTGDKDCKDFKTQAEAQAYFNSKGGSSTNNVDKLDGNDHDGKVCETLP